MKDSPTSQAKEPRRSRPVRVAAAIKDWVVSQGLQKGDRLPAEAEMMARFGMAKGTIREAMRILQAQGLVETRTGPGGGSFVGEVTGERARALLANYFYFKNLTVADIYDIRIALEPELAASLAGRLDADALAELEALIASYAAPATDIDEEREQHVASLRFHAKLASHAQNPLLGFLIGFTSQMLSDLTVYRKLYEPPNPMLWESGRGYQLQLIDALRNGEGTRAREVMRAHMENARTQMQGQEAEVLKRFIEE